MTMSGARTRTNEQTGTRACIGCGQPFEPRRQGQFACCPACRARAHRERQETGIRGRVSSVSATRGGGRAVTLYFPPETAHLVATADVGQPVGLLFPTQEETDDA